MMTDDEAATCACDILTASLGATATLWQSGTDGSTDVADALISALDHADALLVLASMSALCSVLLWGAANRSGIPASDLLLTLRRALVES